MTTKNELLADLTDLDPELGAFAKKQRWTKALLVAAVEEVLTWEDEKDSKKESMASHLNRYKAGYETCTSYSGSKSLFNGDDVASKLAGMHPHDVARFAEQLLELDPGSLLDRYAHLNMGQIRMNSGNRIRAAVKRGDLTAEQVVKAKFQA